MSGRPTEKNLATRFPTGPGEAVSAGNEELRGEFRRLLQQIGAPDNFEGIASLSHSLRLSRVEDLLTFKIFLEEYQSQILFRLELPAIARASAHAARGEARELICFDQELSQQAIWQVLASASQRVGRAQLEQLRPLRDQRVVQRYLAAVESGQASAWHTIVYGMGLAIYSLPLRQGLSNYAVQTMAGFISAAGRRHRFSETTCRELLDGLLVSLPENLERLLAARETPLAALR